METPTAPLEDANVSNVIVHNCSDSDIPNVLVKTEVIESEVQTELS